MEVEYDADGFHVGVVQVKIRKEDIAKVLDIREDLIVDSLIDKITEYIEKSWRQQDTIHEEIKSWVSDLSDDEFEALLAQ